MREGPVAGMDAGSEREGSDGSSREMDRKFRVALILYVILAVLSWFTLDAKIPVGGKLVELRLVPLVILGGMALRTVVAMKAEKIRRQDGETSAKVFESRVDRKVGL
ncbi:MAG TPA: hypothetical protein VGI45_09270 [Terracidiphilus sp.]